MKDTFSQIGDIAASAFKVLAPHPLVHRTKTLDCGVVIDGELTLALDDSDVDMRGGDVVIQRGANHALADRSGKMYRMLFILADGTYEPRLKAALANR